MDVDSESDNDQQGSYMGNYQRATTSDMYGPQMIGRRSFGGFNPPMEEAWKTSKAAMEGDESAFNKKKQSISDEELIRRYQEIAKQRSAGNRPQNTVNVNGKRKGR